MCSSNSLIFIALCILSVSSKPLESQEVEPAPAQSPAPANDLNPTEVFLDFLKKALNGSVEVQSAPEQSSASSNDLDPTEVFLEFFKKVLNGSVTPSTIPLEVQPKTEKAVVTQPDPTIPSIITSPVQVLPNNPVESQVNSTVQQWGNTRIITPRRVDVVSVPDLLTPEQHKKQAENAKYQFSTYMDDNIKGSFLSRSEVRNGLQTEGQYEYDDGHVHRFVHYEADENGYRTVRDETKPSSKTTPLDGTARVQILLDGTQLDYHIAKKDVTSPTHLIA